MEEACSSRHKGASIASNIFPLGFGAIVIVIVMWLLPIKLPVGSELRSYKLCERTL